MLAGLGIGVLVAAPIGPVNVLCIQRSATRGFWAGVAAGIGAVLLCWLGLAELISTIRHRLNESRLRLINQVAGTLLIAFGAILLLNELVLHWR